MFKWILKSKTIWVNLVAVAATWLLKDYNIAVSAEEQVTILVFINLILRKITNSAVTWSFK